MTLRFKRAKSLIDLKCSEGLDIISDLTRWPVCKKYLGKQVAKCVNECKSQAAEAKKVVKGLTKTKKKRFQVASGSAGEPDDFDSADGWSSDEFDTGDEDDGDEREYSNTITEVGFSVSDFISDNSSANGPESVASSESSGQYHDVTLDIRSSMPGRTGVWNLKSPSSGRELDTASPEPSVVLKSMSRLKTDGGLSPPSPLVSPSPSPTGRSPKSKAPSPSLNLSAEKVSPNSGGIGKVVQRRFMPKLQRPHSLPPAPPPPRISLEQEAAEVLVEEKDWEYEIPNSGIPDQQVPLTVAPIPPVRHRTQSALANGAQHRVQSDRRSLQQELPLHHYPHTQAGTYENVDKDEEDNYETVEDDVPRVQSPGRQESVSPGQKPFLPPRKPAPLPPHLLPPPPSFQQAPHNSPTMSEPDASSPEETSSPLASPEAHPNSRRSVSLLIDEFRNKLGQQLGGGGFLTDRVDMDIVQAPENGVQRVNGLSTSDSEMPEANYPPPPPLPLSEPPSPLGDVTGNEDPSSMSDRPLPPVPSSQQKCMREDLSQLPYYVSVERDEAERRLLSMGQDEAYLVRPSRRGGADNPHTLSLIHKGRPFHLNVRLRPDGLYALGRKKEHEVVFGSISSLVSHHQQYPIYLSVQGVTVGTSLLARHP